MNPLLSLFLLYSFFNYSEAECGIRTYSCQCKDFKSLPSFDPKVAGTSGPNCSFNYSCARKNDVFHLILDENSFPKPDDRDERYPKFIVEFWDNATVRQNDNVQDIFGIKCKNGDWVATLFPSGIIYNVVNFRRGDIPPEDVNGKGYESLINTFACSPVLD